MYRIVATLVLALLTSGTALAEQLRLANGDTINGKIIEWAVEHVVIEHPQLGKVRLTLDQLAIDTGEVPNKGLFGTNFLQGWKRTVKLGFNGRSGRGLLRNITSGLDFSYDDPFRRWKITGSTFYNEDDDGVGDNYAIVDVRRDWLFPGSKWFARASGRYQFDQFESWKHRVTIFSGPGYHLVNREAHKLDVAFGPSFTREFGEREDSKAEALFAVDYEWKFSERLGFTFSNQAFIEITPSGGDLRNFTVGELKIGLLEDPELSFSIGARNEYETNPDNDDENNDVRYHFMFGLDF